MDVRQALETILEEARSLKTWADTTTTTDPVVLLNCTAASMGLMRRLSEEALKSWDSATSDLPPCPVCGKTTHGEPSDTEASDALASGSEGVGAGMKPYDRPSEPASVPKPSDPRYDRPCPGPGCGVRIGSHGPVDSARCLAKLGLEDSVTRKGGYQGSAGPVPKRVDGPAAGFNPPVSDTGQSAEHETEWVVTFEFVERDNAEAFSEDLMLWLTDHVPAPRHFQAQAVREIRQQLGTETVCPRYWLYEDASPSIGPAKEVSGPDHDVKSPDGNAARASAEPAVPSGDRSATGPSSDRYPTLRATRGVQSGDLCVGRTRIPTASLWGLWENRGLKPGDVQALYPDLTIDEVEWAMEYERRQRSYHGPSDDYARSVPEARRLITRLLECHGFLAEKAGEDRNCKTVREALAWLEEHGTPSPSVTSNETPS